MKPVTVHRDDCVASLDVTEAVGLLLERVTNSEEWFEGYFDADEEDRILALAVAAEFGDADALAAGVTRRRQEREEAQRRRDALARTQAERQEQERMAAEQLAAEMIAAEPHLASWPVGGLVALHRMRNAGMA